MKNISVGGAWKEECSPSGDECTMTTAAHYHRKQRKGEGESTHVTDRCHMLPIATKPLSL